MVTKAASFTGDRISGALSAPYDVFSGKQDEKLGLKGVLNTNNALMKAMQLMMAMSPEERKIADIKAGRTANKKNERTRS